MTVRQQDMKALLRYKRKVLRAMLGTLIRISYDEHQNEMNGKMVINLIKVHGVKGLVHIL